MLRSETKNQMQVGSGISASARYLRSPNAAVKPSFASQPRHLGCAWITTEPGP